MLGSRFALCFLVSLASLPLLPAQSLSFATLGTQDSLRPFRAVIRSAQLVSSSGRRPRFLPPHFQGATSVEYFTGTSPDDCPGHGLRFLSDAGVAGWFLSPADDGTNPIAKIDKSLIPPFASVQIDAELWANQPTQVLLQLHLPPESPTNACRVVAPSAWVNFARRPDLMSWTAEVSLRPSSWHPLRATVETFEQPVSATFLIELQPRASNDVVWIRNVRLTESSK